MGGGEKNYKASLRACLVIISFRWKNTNATQEAASCSRQPPSDIWMGGRLMVEELKETTLQTKWVGKSLHHSSCITDSQEPTNHNTFTGQNLVKKKKKRLQYEQFYVQRLGTFYSYWSRNTICHDWIVQQWSDNPQRQNMITANELFLGLSILKIAVAKNTLHTEWHIHNDIHAPCGRQIRNQEHFACSHTYSTMTSLSFPKVS